MAYQSEAALEQQFIEQLNKLGIYHSRKFTDYDAMVKNFKVQFEAFSRQSWYAYHLIKSGSVSFNLMLGKSVTSRAQKS